MAPPWPPIQVKVAMDDSVEDALQRHRSICRDVIHFATQHPHEKADSAYVECMARQTENLLRWITQQITANRGATPSSTATAAAATESGCQSRPTLTKTGNPNNASQPAEPRVIICIDDSDDDASSSDTDQDQAKLRPSSALHYPGHETKNSQNDEKEESEEDEVFDRKTFDSEQEEDIKQDAGEVLPGVGFLGGRAGPRVDDKDTEESSKRDFPGSEDYDSEFSATEYEEDARQDAGEALPDVEWIGGPTEHRVDDGDPEEYSESDLSEKYSETSDAAHDYQGDTRPGIPKRGDQDMADAQQADDDDNGSSMDTASDFSDRPQGIRSWIPSHVEEDLPEETSALSVEPVEHWPPDLSAWASAISKMPDSDPNKHLVRVEWNPNYPHTQLPTAEMRSIIQDICLQREVVIRWIKVLPTHVVDIYLDTAAGRSKLITSQSQWLHMISVDGFSAKIDTSARPPPPRVPNRAQELPFTFKIHWTCNCPPYKGWTSSQDATSIVENIRAALECSGDYLLAAAAPRVHAVQIRPRSGDIWVYVCSIPARNYMIQEENARLWVPHLKCGHTAQIHLQSVSSKGHTTTIQMYSSLANATGNSRRRGIEDEIRSQRQKKRRESRRRQRVRQRRRKRQRERKKQQKRQERQEREGGYGS
ncbi:hypothetical protein PoHVEF18_002264 [Penicillium ochrochloron]